MTRSRDEWGKIMDEHGIIWGPVLGLHEVSQDPQAEAINLFPSSVLTCSPTTSLLSEVILWDGLLGDDGEGRCDCDPSSI